MADCRNMTYSRHDNFKSRGKQLERKLNRKRIKNFCRDIIENYELLKEEEALIEKGELLE